MNKYNEIFIYDTINNNIEYTLPLKYFKASYEPPDYVCGKEDRTAWPDGRLLIRMIIPADDRKTDLHLLSFLADLGVTFGDRLHYAFCGERKHSLVVKTPNDGNFCNVTIDDIYLHEETIEIVGRGEKQIDKNSQNPTYSFGIAAISTNEKGFVCHHLCLYEDSVSQDDFSALEKELNESEEFGIKGRIGKDIKLIPLSGEYLDFFKTNIFRSDGE